MSRRSRASLAFCTVLTVSSMVLSACATAPTPAPTPTQESSPSPSPTPEAERPAPSFGGACADLADDSAILGLVGVDLPLVTGAAPDAPLTSYAAAYLVAGGLLTCVWGPGDGGGANVHIEILPRFAGDTFDMTFDGESPSCFASNGMAGCGHTFTANGYWVEISLREIGDLDNADARFADFVTTVTEVVTGAPVAPTAGPVAPSALAAPLCTSGAATLSAAFGVEESAIVEPGHGSEWGIRPSAYVRAGAGDCPWRIAGFGDWGFWFLADGAWAFDEPLQPYMVDRGLSEPFPLTSVDLDGAQSARAGCTHDRCEAQMVVGDDLLIVIGEGFDGDFVDQVAKVLAAA